MVQDAPPLNRTVSSFDIQNAEVTGTAALQLRVEKDRSITVSSGHLVGEIVSRSAGGSSGPKLQGYIKSDAQCGAWIAKNKQLLRRQMRRGQPKDS